MVPVCQGPALQCTGLQGHPSVYLPGKKTVLPEQPREKHVSCKLLCTIQQYH